MTTGVRRAYRDWYRPVQSPASRYFMFGKRCPPRGQRVWRFALWGFLFDSLDGLLCGCFAWDRSCSPSYADALLTAWDNLCKWLTPHLRPRRALLSALGGDNDCKLLDSDRKSLFMRNRRNHLTYCRIRCTRRGMTVSVSPEGPEGPCEWRVVAEGPCRTWGECDRLYMTVRQATPELDWF